MSFFGLPDHDLEAERQRIRSSAANGGLHETEDVAVYTWGEESYDGLGDALLEGGDDLNDETFGGTGAVGKDFDFAGQTKLLDTQLPPPARVEQRPIHESETPPSRPALDSLPSLESIWDDKSPFSVLPRENGAPHRQQPSQYSPFDSPTQHQASPSLSGARTVQEIEAEMRAAVHSRNAIQRQHQQQNALRLQQQQEEQQFLLQEQAMRERVALEREEREQQLHIQALQRLQQQQSFQLRGQRTPPPRMLPVSQSPRFVDQRQLLLLQQQEELQLRLQQQELQIQEALRMEELERQLRAQQISQLNQGPQHFSHRRQASGPTIAELQALQQAQRSHRSRSPAYNAAPQNAQRLLELAQADYLPPAEQEALRAEAMRKILEAEKLEEKRRRKAHKIAHMSRYNDLMTQSDKDFITRIQVSQLVTPDPYADDFYAQVYSAILRSRMGLQSQDDRVLKFGSGGGISLGAPQKAPTRRPNAMQRMEQQVERIVNNARRREEEKGLHSLHSLQGALGKTSGRSYKAAPRQLLQVDDNGASSPTHPHAHISKEDAKDAAQEAVRLSRETLGHGGNVVRKDPLTHRQVLTILEFLYDLVLKVEQMRRDQPPEEDVELHEQWKEEYDGVVEQLWEGLRVMVPLETSNPHPFVSLLQPSKGKRLLPRLTRHIDPSRMLTLMTLLVACFTQLDVVKQAPLLDTLDDSPDLSEVDRQTQAFLTSVLQSILPVVTKLDLNIVTALLDLLIERTENIGLLTQTKPGLALVTLFLTRVEVIKQSWHTGAEPVDPIVADTYLEQWQSVFDQFFHLLTPHLLQLFPSSRIQVDARHPASVALTIEIIDQPVWQFLATLALLSRPEQHQILVTSLREKVLDNVRSANSGWVQDEEERSTKLANLRGSRTMLRLLALLLLSITGLVRAASSHGHSLLVIVEDAQKDDFSIFYDDLRAQGYEVSFRAPKDTTPALVEFDVPAFSHVAILASESKNFAKDITPQSLVELVSAGTNLLIGLSQKQTPLSSLAAEFSLILPPPGTPLVSFFPERPESPSLIPISPPAGSALLPTTQSAVWFSGIPIALGSNPLLFPILPAPAESFAGDVTAGGDALVDAAEKGGEGLWAGSQVAAVAGFQAIGGARVAWLGGVDVLNDELAQKELSKAIKSGNSKFARDLAAWTFQENLVLRIDHTEHHLVNKTEPLEMYTTNDNIVFTAHISRFDPKSTKWEPYSGIKDMQFEFTMLDPHIRVALPAVPGAPGKYSTTFRAPDRHGVFKFVVNYKRKGWTHLHSSTTVSLVPPRHDGYPRFLSAAWPFYPTSAPTTNAKQKQPERPRLEEVPEESEEEYYDYSAEEEDAGYGLADALDGDGGWGPGAGAGGTTYDAWGAAGGSGAKHAPPPDGGWGAAAATPGAWGATSAPAQVPSDTGWGAPAPSAAGWAGPTPSNAGSGWNTTTTIPTPAQLAAQHAAATAAAVSASTAANKGKKPDKPAQPQSAAWQSWGREGTSASAWGTDSAPKKQQPQQAWQSWGKTDPPKAGGGDAWGTGKGADAWGTTKAGGDAWGKAKGGADAWGAAKTSSDAFGAPSGGRWGAPSGGGWGAGSGGGWGATSGGWDSGGGGGGWDSGGGGPGWGATDTANDWGVADDTGWGGPQEQHNQWRYDEHKMSSGKKGKKEQQQGKKGKKAKQKQADPWAAATGAGGGWDSGGWAASGGEWGTGDGGGWGAQDSSDTEDEDERRVHFTPISTSVWGGSHHGSTYHMPSRTLAHAYEGSTTPLFPGPPRNKISEEANIQFIDSKGAAILPAQQALFGHTKRAARDRIHWMFSPNKDERVSSLLSWIEIMSYHVGAYGLHRFLQSRERGALITNADFRPPDNPNEPAFDWLTFDQLQATRDKILQESVALYDPSVTAIVFIFLPSKTGNSVAMWRRKIKIPNNTRAARINEIRLAIAGLRRDKDYVVHVDEISGKKGDKKKLTTAAPSVPAKTKSTTKYEYGKTYYPYEVEKKQKKKKWWRIFG
ncbi:PAT1 domain-containing protein [Mycena kentingensis (nom. inval.)]|nr:PAT1 domain-containing protein [Mycena kentingensis (nom. inval.)]